MQLPTDEDVDADRDDHEREHDRDAAPRESSGPRASAASSLEHEADAAHGLDQRRLAELAAQIGDVAVDGVRARGRLLAPDASSA